MANMSYCRFENTFADFEDCLDTLRNYGSIQAAFNDINTTDRRFIRQLVELAVQMADEFGDELHDKPQNKIEQ